MKATPTPATDSSSGNVTTNRSRRPVRHLHLLMLWGALSAAASANTITETGTIPGTGLAGPGKLDSNWNVVGIPGAWASPPSSVPYQAYTLQTGAVGWGADEPAGNQSQPWNDPQEGFTNSAGTFYWINLQSTDASVINFGDGPSTWIVGQSFNVTTAGYYAFTFEAMADELLDIYINGTVSPDSKLPTIVGGTKVSSSTGATGANGVNFRSHTSVTTSAAYLDSGTNTFYARVTDNGFSTGLLMTDITFSASTGGVPEIDPSGVASALGLVIGALALLELRRTRAV